MSETTTLNRFLHVIPETIETTVVNEIDGMPGMSDSTVESLKTVEMRMQQKLETVQEENPSSTEIVTEKERGCEKEMKLLEKRIQQPKRKGIMEEAMERRK